MLFAFWNVADVIAKKKVLSSLFIVIGRCYCHIYSGRCYTTFHYIATHCIGQCYCQVADGIATYCYYCFVMADVIAQWQMEWPLQGGSDLSPGRCCSQGADGCSWVYLF